MKHKDIGRSQETETIDTYSQRCTSKELKIASCPMVKTCNYLLNQLDTGQQVHTEIDEGPLDAFLSVFFLFKYEHVVVKELLQLFVGEVNAKLLETVVLEIQETDGYSTHRGTEYQQTSSMLVLRI